MLHLVQSYKKKQQASIQTNGWTVRFSSWIFLYKNNVMVKSDTMHTPLTSIKYTSDSYVRYSSTSKS